MRSFLFGLFLLLFPNTGMAQLSPEIHARVEASGLHGTYLLAREGRVLAQGSCGIADRERMLAFTGDEKFRIASITKAFTAVLVMQLVQEGRLELQAPIHRYLPWYAGQGGPTVTVEQLLTFSSGIPNCEGDQGMGVYQVLLPVDSFINHHCSGDLAFEPGSQFAYDNGAYILLGRIIETVTGDTFSAELHRRILGPLGMRDTDLLRTEDVVPGLVTGYLLDSAGTWHRDPPYYIEQYGPAGALRSTPADLLRFDQALFTGQLLDAAQLQRLLTPFRHLWNVALGFWVVDRDFAGTSTRVADRQGSIQGNNSTWLHLIPENITVIVFSNTNATDLTAVRDLLVEHALAH